MISFRRAVGCEGDFVAHFRWEATVGAKQVLRSETQCQSNRRRKALERILRQQHQVGPFADLDRPQLASQAERLGIVERRRAQNAGSGMPASAHCCSSRRPFRPGGLPTPSPDGVSLPKMSGTCSRRHEPRRGAVPAEFAEAMSVAAPPLSPAFRAACVVLVGERSPRRLRFVRPQIGNDRGRQRPAQARIVDDGPIEDRLVVLQVPAASAERARPHARLLR